MSYREKILPLERTCAIQSGYTARSRLEPTTQGGVPAIQLGDLRGDGDFDPSELPRYSLSGSFDRYWAGPGDVLFRSRGEHNTAVAISSTCKGAAIALLPLLILRPNPDLVDPQYLAWVLNHPASQRYFDTCARGTRLRMIPKPCLERVDVPVPDLATQRSVVEIDALARRERSLMLRLIEKKAKFVNFALLEQVRKAQPHGSGAGQVVARKRQKPAGKVKRTDI